MNLKRTALAALFGAVACAATVSAASAQPFDARHPRQAQVIGRADHQRLMIRHDVRTGRISPARAHRLLVVNQRVTRQEHRMARNNGGYITAGQQHRLNRQENRLAHRIPG